MQSIGRSATLGKVSSQLGAAQSRVPCEKKERKNDGKRQKSARGRRGGEPILTWDEGEKGAGRKKQRWREMGTLEGGGGMRVF